MKEKLKKIAKVSLKVLGGLLVTAIVLVAGTIYTVTRPSVQVQLLQYATELLSEHLKTKVLMDSISIQPWGQDVSLHGVTIYDQQQRKMFEMKRLGVELDLWKLINREIYITEASISGLTARLYKPATDSDSVANYQFVIEAFKKPKPLQIPVDTIKLPPPPKKKLNFNADKITLERISVSYNDQESSLGKLVYKKNWRGRQSIDITDVITNWNHTNKKGITISNRIRVAKARYYEKDSIRHIDIDSVFYFTNNPLPRKNTGKPKRGFFDAGHLDIVAMLHFRLDHADKDSIAATLVEGTACDRGSGLKVTDLRFHVVTDKKTAQLSDFTVCMPNTTLKFAKGTIQLPSKKKGIKLKYNTSLITGRTLLTDISKPFAPALKKFLIPVTLQTYMSGNDESMKFSNVKVATADKQLQISATGGITGLKDKYKLHVHFDVHHMTTSAKKAIDIINQFPLKRKFMMKQLDNLGSITYHGHFDVIWKKELFAGKLHTNHGDINFQLQLDEKQKYLTGVAQTDSLELGKAMDMPDIGRIVCKANFKFDYSKQRTAQMRKLKGGKLPIGHIDAEVAECKYKKIRMKNVVSEINSDGAVAEGKLTMKGGRVDLICSFSFTNTNEMKKTKIKPGIRFHKLSEEDKQAREERKAAKKAEKAERKAAKAAEKAERKAQKEAEKAERKALKEQEKAERKAQKEQEKAARKAEKEARKAEKEARKAAKKQGLSTEEVSAGVKSQENKQ